MLVLDDLHWADVGTVAVLRHVARFAPRGRLLVVGAYRDVEVGRAHPLAEVLGVVPRETTYDQVALAGLEPAAVQELLEAVADHDVAQRLVATIARETSGNPFFIRAVMLHLLEEGLLAPDGASWRLASNLDRIGLPDTVRQVIERRLVRISEAALRLLRVAAAFTGGIDFEVARRVAELEEGRALDALDEALGAQLLVGTADPRTYDFTHALVRHVLYEALNPARQVRLHRQLAETMEMVYGERALEHVAEIARHYHRSATLPGAERGLPYCLAAAEQAERATAFADVADHLQAALELLPRKASERSRILGRLGLALAYGLRFDECVGAACDAAAGIAETEGGLAAARYLVQVLHALGDAGSPTSMERLYRHGLEHAGEHGDATWAVLKVFETIEREVNDPIGFGIPSDTDERRAITEILKASGMVRAVPWGFLAWRSRDDILAVDAVPEYHFKVGEYGRGLRVLREDAEHSEQEGKIGRAVELWASVSRFHIALGEFAEAQEARSRGAALAERLSEPSMATAQLVAAEDEWRLAMDEGWDIPMQRVGPPPGEGWPRRVYRAANIAGIARMHARMGRVELAMRRLTSVLPTVERAPGWSENYPRIACDVAETLWLTQRTDHLDVIERNLREKVIAPDFRYPMMDGRLALARLCALQARWEEAAEWFAKARTMLDEQGARPLRAIVDYDEALMYARRGEPGDAERARPLLNAALAQFRSLGMPGWIRRAEALAERYAASGEGSPPAL